MTKLPPAKIPVTKTRHGSRVSNWLRHVRDVSEKPMACVDAVSGEESRGNLLCELNVIEPVGNVSRTTMVRDACHRGLQLTVLARWGRG